MIWPGAISQSMRLLSCRSTQWRLNVRCMSGCWISMVDELTWHAASLLSC